MSADDFEKLYGIALCLEVYEAIRDIKANGSRATNITIRDHLLDKHEVNGVKGVRKLNITRRISSTTKKMTELGYLTASTRKSKKLQTEYYEFKINH